MSELLLAVNIGNTTIECGVFDRTRLETSWQLSSEVKRMPDECWQSTTFFCREAGFDPDDLTALAVGSVVPDHTYSFVRMASARFDKNPLVISVDNCPFLNVKYNDPRQVGADRLCNGFAGFHYYGGPLVVVDFGTAITLDVVDSDGGYLGGVILAGPMTTAQALHRRTAQLPRVSHKFPEQVIGRSTDLSIQAGLTWGVIDMVDGLVERISSELPEKPKVIATGGYASPYAKRSRFFSELRLDLVLDGIRLIHERARESQ